jgi:hypothetical protein
VYTDAALTTAHSNPIICDSGGYPTSDGSTQSPIYGAPDDFKFVLHTSADVEVWTIDDLTLIDPVTATAVPSTSITSDTTVTADDYDRLFNVDASSGNVTLTADSATLGSGFRFTVRLSSSANSAIVQPTGGQTINGASSFTLSTQYDTATFVSNGAGGFDIISQTLDTAQLVSDNAIQRVQVALGAGRLDYVSSTQVRLVQRDGGYICFPNGTSLAIGSSGITATYNDATIDGTTGQTLTANTVYNVFAYDNSGSLALDFSTTGHTVDAATGIEIKTGDATRVLVGKVLAGSTSQFEDSSTGRYVLSWRNRREARVRNKFTVDRTVSASQSQEINSEIRFGFWLGAMRQSP